MATTGKITATTLLTVGLVLALAGIFVPLGENWIETGSIRDTEVFGLFTYSLERSNDGNHISTDGPTGWSDDQFNAFSGSGQMVAASVAGVVSLLLLVVAVVLTIPGKTTRAGGAVGLFGAVGVGLTVALAVVGMRMRTEQFLGDANALDARVGVFLMAAGFLLAIVGAAVATSIRQNVVAAAPVNAWDDYPAHVAAENEAAAHAAHDAWTTDADGRTLACPDCGTRTTAPAGIVPTCQACGFHSRDQPAYTDTGTARPADGGWATV